MTASIIILNSNRETSFFSSTSFPYGLWEHSTFKPFGLILFASMRQRRKNHTVSNTVIFHQVFKTHSSLESRASEVLKKFTRNNDKTFNVTYKSLCSATDAAEVTDSGRKTVFIKHSFI